MRSRLREVDGLLCESMGPATFRFALRCRDGAIEWRLRSVRVLGIPVPARLFDVAARESVLDGRYRFEVGAAIAGLGPIVAYDGTLDRRS